MTAYDLSTQINLEAVFINSLTGVYADPTSITLFFLNPNGLETSVPWPAPGIIHDSIGHFHYATVPSIAGLWQYKWQGRGAVVATSVDGSFTVNASLFGVTLFESVFNVKAYGAIGNGVADDTAAINAAITAALTATTSGLQATVYFPPGAYVISSTPWGVFSSKGIKLLGSGSTQSFILVGKAISGPVFAWSGCWNSTTFGANSMSFSTYLGSPSVIGLTITADRTSSNTQTALQFYDRNDNVWLQDVTINYMTGHAISVGVTLNDTTASMRESTWIGIRCANCGNAGVPTVELNSAGAGDGTNELNVVGLSIFAPMNGPGLLIGNNGTNSTRTLRFDLLRIEGLQFSQGGNAFSSDHLVINAATGQINQIKIDNARIGLPYTGGNCITVTAGSGALAPFFVSYKGTLEGEGQAGSGNGINIVFGRNLYFEILGEDVLGTVVITAATAGGNNIIDSKGQDSGWSTSLGGGRVLNEHGGIIGTGAVLDLTGGLGYLPGVGAGGSITQTTSKSTGVILNKLTGKVTTTADALAASTIVSFILTNSTIAATDMLVLNHVNGGTIGAYGLNAQCQGGQAIINIRNNTSGSLSEAIGIGFALIKGAVT